MNDQAKRCGFIGLGIMGKPMALNLLRADCDVWAYDINQQACDELKAEGARIQSPAEIGKNCSVIFTILPTGSIVKQVLFEEKLADELAAGSLVVDMSSVTPKDSVDCARALQKRDLHFIDAPLSGGEPKAIDGTLAFMAGGETADFEKALPFFEIMGSSAKLIGGHGSGSVAKLTNQVIVNLTIAAVSEAFVLAQKAGVDAESVYEAIRGGLAGSTVLDAKLPMIMDRNFAPGGKISINLKDIKNVMATAHDIDVPMPFSGQLLEVMQSLKVQNGLNDDHCGIVKYFERLADVEVTRHQDADKQI